MSLLTGLERFYKLNGNAVDSVAAQNGTATGVTWAAGKVDAQAADFNADVARSIVAAGLNLLTDISIQAWIYVTATGTAAYFPVVCNMDGGGGASTNWALMNDGTGNRLAFMGTGNVFSAPSATFAAGAWHHVVATRTTGGSINLYVDGSLTGTSPGTGPGPNSVPAADLRIGSREDAYSAFPGRICQVGVWSRILSPAEVASLYNGGAGLSFSAFSPAPTITAITPSSGPSAGDLGTWYSVTGTNFQSGATVKVGGTSCPAVVFYNAGRIDVTLPPGTVGAADVVVTNPDAQTATLAGGFTYLAPPPVYTRYGSLLARLLPPGRLYALEHGSTLRKLLIGLGDELARVEARGADLINESDPRTADETIADWEAAVSLPDDLVTSIPATLAQRRNAVTQKLIARGGATLDYYYALITACGYGVDDLTAYSDGALLRVGARVASYPTSGGYWDGTHLWIDCRVFDATFAYTLRISVGAPGPDAIPQADFERVIQRRTHAHIRCLFAYV